MAVKIRNGASLNYLDLETTGLDIYDPQFQVRLIGVWRDGHYLSSPVFPMGESIPRSIIEWGNYDSKILTKLGIEHQATNLKLRYHLYDERRHWSLEETLDYVGIPNHKYLVKNWELEGYDWATVPMFHLLPYNLLDCQRMEPLAAWVEGKYDKRQDLLLQETQECLNRMELAGVAFDMEESKRQEKHFTALFEAQQKKLKSLKDINWDSPQQIGEVLIKEGYPLTKTKKRHYKVDRETLKELYEQKPTPILAEYLTYTLYDSILRTFIIGIRDQIRGDGLLHPEYNFIRTGRYSCTKPNLQNLPSPKKNADLYIQRRQIVSKWHEEGTLIAIDWAMLELYLLAQVYPIQGLIKDIAAGIDVHQRSADMLQVKRSPFAKNCNFSVCYGGSDWTLNTRYGVTKSNARKFIKDWFNRYPDLRTAHNTMSQQAEEGIVVNKFGRIRHINKPFQVYNSHIQSIAADLNKMMLIMLSKKLIKQGFQTHCIMDVHDELVLDTPKKEVKEVLDKVIKVCYNDINNEIERRFQVHFPLKFKYEIKMGANYYDMKEITHG